MSQRREHYEHTVLSVMALNSIYICDTENEHQAVILQIVPGLFDENVRFGSAKQSQLARSMHIQEPHATTA